MIHTVKSKIIKSLSDHDAELLIILLKILINNIIKN